MLAALAGGVLLFVANFSHVLSLSLYLDTIG